MELTLWITTALMGVLAISQALGSTPLIVLFVGHAITWYALAPALPIAIVAAVTRVDGWWLLVVVNAAIAAAHAALLWPVLRHERAPAPAPEDPSFSLVFANTYYENERTADTAAALLDLDPDVIALAEYTPDMESSLRAKGAFERYRFQVGAADVTRDGIVLMSKLPLMDGVHHRIGDVPGVDATLDVEGRAVRVLVVHPLAPLHRRDLRSWRRDLATYRQLLSAAADGPAPMVVVGDFNAARGHPELRALVDRTPFRSAHEWLGRGFSTSWPIDGVMPPFVRIDHAFVHALVPVRVDDLDTPGSDHRGFELRCSVPRTATGR